MGYYGYSKRPRRRETWTLIRSLTEDMSLPWCIDAHNIDTVSNIKIGPVWKIKEYRPLHPQESFTCQLLLGLSQYSIDVLNLLKNLLTS